MKIWKNLFGKDDKIHVDEIAMKQGNNPTLLSGAVIVESGSNANGRYVKFGDGTMVCTAQINYDLNNSVFKTYTMPATFVGVISASWCVGNFSSAPGRKDSVWKTIVMRARNSLWQLRDFSTDSGIEETMPINLLAIGRWK